MFVGFHVWLSHIIFWFHDHDQLFPTASIHDTWTRLWRPRNIDASSLSVSSPVCSHFALPGETEISWIFKSIRTQMLRDFVPHLCCCAGKRDCVPQKAQDVCVCVWEFFKSLEASVVILRWTIRHFLHKTCFWWCLVRRSESVIGQNSSLRYLINVQD